MDMDYDSDLDLACACGRCGRDENQLTPRRFWPKPTPIPTAKSKKNTTVTALGKINERGFSVACNWGLSSVGYVFKIRLLPNLLETNLLA